LLRRASAASSARRTNMKDFIDDDGNAVFKPARKSRSSRKLAKRSKISGRGGITTLQGPKNRVQITKFESLLEMKVLCILLADPTTLEVREQPPGFHYTDHTGAKRIYTGDLLQIKTDGSRILHEIKPHEMAAKPALKQKLKNVRAAMHKGIADKLILVTDADFTRDHSLNAQRLLMFKPHISQEHAARVDAILPLLTYPVTIAEAVEALDIGSAGFQALFPALFDGRLAVDPSAEFTFQTRLHKGKEL